MPQIRDIVLNYFNLEKADIYSESMNGMVININSKYYFINFSDQPIVEHYTDKRIWVRNTIEALTLKAVIKSKLKELE